LDLGRADGAERDRHHDRRRRRRGQRLLSHAPTPDAIRALVRRHIDDGFNRGDWNVCQETLADDYTAHYDSEGRAQVGRERYVRACTYLRRSFPDVAITVEDLVVEGDRVVLRYTERGTLSGRPFLGIEPTGQAYAKPGATLYRVADARLAESWGVEDTLGWFRQLGQIPDLPVDR